MSARAKRENRRTKRCLKVALEVSNRKMFHLNIQANADIRRRERMLSAQYNRSH